MNPSPEGRPGRLPPLSPMVVVLAVIVVVIVGYGFATGSLGLVQIVQFAVFIPAVVLHEVSHGALARVFGDRTAEQQGRLTLNPLRHLDVFGTFILPGLLLITNAFAGGGVPILGWAKPVPVNTSRMSANQTMLTGLVGPATNVLLVALTVGVLYLFSVALDDVALLVLYLFGSVNVILAVFNLLPIPPLDGAAVVERFLPRRYWPSYLKVRQYAFILLFLVLFAFQGSLSLLF